MFPGIEPRGDLPAEKRRQVVSDVKSIFLHKVGGVISYSVDNVIISAFLGLVAVAAYGNYYYVVTSVAGIVGIVYSSMTAGFGNKIHTETKEENFRLFMKMTRLAQLLILWCAAMMMALYQPFVFTWTKGDPVLVRHIITPILMVLYFYVNQSRQMLLTFKSAAALWRQDRWKPIVAGAVNLGANVLFVIFLPDAYKLDGVIFSTVISYVFIQIPWESHVVFANFFNGVQARVYWRTHVGFAFLALVLCGVTWGAASCVPIGGIGGLAVKGVLAVAVSTGLLLAIFRKDIPAAVKILRKGKSRA